MESIAEPLRKVAAGVFEEMDRLKQEELTAAVTELHHESDSVTGGADGGDGGDGRKSDSDGGRRREGGRELKETTQNEEGERDGKGDIIGGEIEGEKGMKSPTSALLHDGPTGAPVKLQESLEDAKNASIGKLEGNTELKSAYTTANFKSQEKDHNIIGTGTGIEMSSGLQPLSELSPLAQRQLLVSPSLDKGTARTNNVLHHSPLAKDKAA